MYEIWKKKKKAKKIIFSYLMIREKKKKIEINIYTAFLCNPADTDSKITV